MAVDTPARIAVVGAGPVGLEAALYARYLGYTVDLYERGRAAEHLLRRGHLRSFTPWTANVTSLGVAALRAQSSEWHPLQADEQPTYAELVERYFQPLADSDLLIDCLQPGVEVVGIGREGMLKGDFPLDERRADVPFRLLLREADGAERRENADVVLDCSGLFGTPNRLGNGGLPAIGELHCERRIEYGIPDATGNDRERYVGKHTLVVGGGDAAATTVTSLARLFADDRETRITWITRRANPTEGAAPLPDDRLAARNELVRRANLLATEPQGPLAHWPATFVEAVSYDEATSQFAVECSGRHGGHASFDRVVANVGYRPDHRLYDELQVQRHPAADGLPYLTVGNPITPQSLLTPEPDFYVLGRKSFGRASRYLPTDGHEQIRVLFTLLGDREGLNLYATHSA